MNVFLIIFFKCQSNVDNDKPNSMKLINLNEGRKNEMGRACFTC